MPLVVLDTVRGVNVGNVITFNVSGDFRHTKSFLEKAKLFEIDSILDQYGSRGVEILRNSTPVRTGVTASSWGYEKENSGSTISITWYNTNLANDGKTPVIILIIKGHGTKNGGYVAANDFVTPLMSDLCDEAADAVWKAVTNE